MNLNTTQIAVLLIGVCIPLSALAAYATDPVEQKPSVLIECIDQKCKEIATITPPPITRIEAVYVDYKTSKIRAEAQEMNRRNAEYMNSFEYKAMIRRMEG
jgi:hypothetical protein